MNNIIVKSTSGIFWGTIGSLASVYIANIYQSKNLTEENFIKKKLYLPLAFGGVIGFLIGFINTPIISLLLKKSK